MMYTKTEVEKLLSRYFHNNWDTGEETGPEPGMPRAKKNPARSGGILAQKVDLERAIKYIGGDIPLEMRYATGATYDAIGQELGVTSETASSLLEMLVSELVDEMNTADLRKHRK